MFTCTPRWRARRGRRWPTPRRSTAHSSHRSSRHRACQMSLARVHTKREAAALTSRERPLAGAHQLDHRPEPATRSAPRSNLDGTPRRYPVPFQQSAAPSELEERPERVLDPSPRPASSRAALAVESHQPTRVGRVDLLELAHRRPARVVALAGEGALGIALAATAHVAPRGERAPHGRVHLERVVHHLQRRRGRSITWGRRSGGG